ncbi:MAG: GntR family transcriptional regulator [Sphaerochaetaceae bacterium]|jgi:DNA-binding GntR family transcriptional regulator
MKVQGGDIANTVFETLRQEILDLTVKPGEPLLESVVCERFGASRTPVRTAFQRLSDAGLIEITPYKGASASLLSMDHIKQMIYMRCAIETNVLEDFIDAYDLFAIEDVEHHLRQQEILLSTSTFTPSDFYRADSAFHRLWFLRMHCERLWDIIQKSESDYTRFRMLDIVEMHMFHDIYQEHVRLVELIKDRDKAAVKVWMSDHLNGGIRRLGEKLSTDFAGFFTKEDERWFSARAI